MDKKDRVYIDLHVIQTVPPSCVNRDDTGSPKTAIYGGVQRARVSSQSWKRAIRKMFQEDMHEEAVGIRTKKIIGMIIKEIQGIDDSVNDDKARKLAEEVVKACGISTKDDEAKALFFISTKQAQNLAKLVLENDKPSKKEAQAMISKDHSIDIALFGRMVADDPTLNADASAQVAHSISTHRVDNEFDYFTAVDDLAPKDNAGAGMIGVVEFNSATLYRYATVAVHELNRELGGEKDAVAEAVVEFVKAFILSMPTGKQNTFANRTLPDAVLVTIRRDQPINFVGAFEKPVKASENGYVSESVKSLSKYADKVYASFASAPEKSWSIGFEGKEHNVNLEKLLEEVKKQITADLAMMD
jgi:CRISPR system Cascade subunit CasC